jgi:2-oxoisovalerate dehydrogenase E2 component (dihydrolipoyl transacylase)
MPVELQMPELAESVIEGEIVKWLVKEGDHVNQDQPLVEVMTDKVTVEVPSPYEGVLLKQVAKEGEVVPIHHVIAIFGKEGESLGDSAAAKPAEAPSAPKQPEPAAKQPEPAAKQTEPQAAKAEPARPATPPAKKEGNGQAGTVEASEAASQSGAGRPLAAPAIRKYAREKGVDLAQVRGSGEGGRIVREDIERALSASKPGAAPARAPQAPSRAPQPPSAPGEVERVPLRGLRRIIADHMAHSKQTAAHTLHVDEADVTELVAMRRRAKDIAAQRGIKLTYLPFFVRAACAGLKRYPYMNASLDDEKHEIILKKDYNIGVAVNTDNGLVVPVIHNADRKTIFELAIEIADLAEKARSGKLSHDEISGGTFTITNVGSVGGLFTFPIINWPEVGILGTHSITPRPVVREGQIVIREMTYLSISFDHRVVDGATAAEFVKEVKAVLEAPDVFLLEGG